MDFFGGWKSIEDRAPFVQHQRVPISTGDLTFANYTQSPIAESIVICLGSPGFAHHIFYQFLYGNSRLEMRFLWYLCCILEDTYLDILQDFPIVFWVAVQQIDSALELRNCRVSDQ